MGKKAAVISGFLAVAVVSVGLLWWPQFAARYGAHRAREGAFVTEVKSAGEYQLFSATGAAPQITVYLEKGESIGFKSGTNGQVIAVAGNREIPLNADSSCYWKRK